MGFITKIWSGVRYLAGLILPIFAKARDAYRLGQAARWILRFVLLVLIFSSLAFIQHYFQINIGLKTSNPLLKNYLWLPLLVLLVYLLFLFGWWLWKLLAAPEEASAFPDIDEAWTEGVGALNQKGIDLTEAPLFLVFGRTGGMEDSIFQASQIQLSVKQTPAKPAAPVHVYGNRDGVYVTCPGASLLGRQAAILAGDVAPIGDGGGEAAVDDDPNKTLQPKGRLLDVQAVLARARESGRNPQALTEEEKQEIKSLVEEEEAEHARRQGRVRSSLLRNIAELEIISARLNHLCRLIVRDRRPYCPLNGVMLLIPLAASDTDEDANQTGELCARDLKAARDILQVHCPLFTLVCDLQTTPGFGDFLDRFPEKERGRRVGQRFPLAPDLDPAKVEAKIEEMVRWIGTSLVPSWVYKLFKVESGQDGLAEAVRGNVRLYRFLSLMRERHKRLARIITRGILMDGKGPLLYGGCYIAGTGREPRDQGFVAGVFQRLTQEQNYVSWTDEALVEESHLRAMTRYAYVGIAILVPVLLGLGYLLIKGSS